MGFFADSLVEVPLGFSSIALANGILPSLSEHNAQKKQAESPDARRALRLVCLRNHARWRCHVSRPLTVVIYPRVSHRIRCRMTRALDGLLAACSLEPPKVMAPLLRRQDTKGPFASRWTLAVTWR